MIREQLSFFPAFAVSEYEAPKEDLRRMPKTGSRREAVLRHLVKAKLRGLTDEEMLDRLVLTSEQLHTARLALMDGGYAYDSGTRRPTRFGDATIVWRATDFGLHQWKESGRK